MVHQGKVIRGRTALTTADSPRSIGHGAALALLEHGAHVTIVSSSEDRVNEVVKKVNNTNFKGTLSTCLSSDVSGFQWFTLV